MTMTPYDKFIEACCLSIESYISNFKLSRTEPTVLKAIPVTIRLRRNDTSKIVNSINERLAVFSGGDNVVVKSAHIMRTSLPSADYVVQLSICPKIHLVTS